MPPFRIPHRAAKSKSRQTRPKYSWEKCCATNLTEAIFGFVYQDTDWNLYWKDKLRSTLPEYVTVIFPADRGSVDAPFFALFRFMGLHFPIPIGEGFQNETEQSVK